MNGKIRWEASGKPMELRRFQQFVTLADEGSFTRAAAELYMAQSSLSESIAALERDLGAQLLIRHRNGVSLTAAGRAFLPLARKTVCDAEQAKRAALGIERQTRPLRVANTFVSPGLEVELAVQDLAALHPDQHVSITHHGLRTVSGLVADGEVDVAFTPVQLPLPGGLKYIPLRSVTFALICSVEHRLAGATGITLDDLAGENLITIDGETMAHDAMVSTFRALGNSSPIQVTADGWMNTVTLARRGFGLALGPVFDHDYYPPDVALVQFAEPPVMESAIVTRDEPRPHEALAEYIGLYLKRLETVPDQPAAAS